MAAAPPPADDTRGAEATTPPALDPNSPEAQSAELLNAVVGQIFSTRRPRDVCAGAASAFKSVAKGFALGVATLIAAPAAVAYNQPEEEQQPQQPQQTKCSKLKPGSGPEIYRNHDFRGGEKLNPSPKRLRKH